MIRDPSDGSVREPVRHRPEALKPKTNLPEKADLGIGPDTGIRQPVRTDAQERLERSREWLKQYRKAVADANSMNDKGEVTNARGRNEQSTSDIPDRSGGGVCGPDRA